MAFTDPQSVAIAGATHVLPRTVTNPTASVFSTPDGVVTMEISQQKGKVLSSLLRIKTSKISTNVLNDVKSLLNAEAYIVLKRPVVGFTQAELEDLIDAAADKAKLEAAKLASGQS